MSASMCVCAPYVCLWRPETGMRFLELEVHAVVSHIMDTGNQTRDSIRSVYANNPWAISLVPPHIEF